MQSLLSFKGFLSSSLISSGHHSTQRVKIIAHHSHIVLRTGTMILVRGKRGNTGLPASMYSEWQELLKCSIRI